MDTAAIGVTQKEDHEEGIDQQNIFYRMVLFLAAITLGLFNRVLGADDSPFCPIMGKRGDAGVAAGSAVTGAGSSASRTTTVAASFFTWMVPYLLFTSPASFEKGGKDWGKTAAMGPAGTGPFNLVLPAVTLGLSNAAIIARMTRSAMIDVMSQDFVRTAHAKGLPKALVLERHVLRAGLVPVVTMMGMQFGPRRTTVFSTPCCPFRTSEAAQ